MCMYRCTNKYSSIPGRTHLWVNWGIDGLLFNTCMDTETCSNLAHTKWLKIGTWHCRLAYDHIWSFGFGKLEKNFNFLNGFVIYIERTIISIIPWNTAYIWFILHFMRRFIFDFSYLCMLGWRIIWVFLPYLGSFQDIAVFPAHAISCPSYQIHTQLLQPHVREYTIPPSCLSSLVA